MEKTFQNNDSLVNQQAIAPVICLLWFLVLISLTSSVAFWGLLLLGIGIAIPVANYFEREAAK